MNSVPVTVADIFAAQRRLRPYLRATPLRRSDWLSGQTSASVHLKLESVQETNSFKIRGALNAALRLLEDEAGTIPDLVTASAGNHGRALAFACQRLGLRVTVFTPRSAPETKKAAIRRHGATLRDESPTYDEAEDAARVYATATGARYLSPYNHGDVIAGAGTVGLEILEALPGVESLVVPVGGGGLAAGVGLAMKAAASTTRVIGVEVEASTPFAVSLERGHITTVAVKDSLADGLTGNLEPDSMTFALVRRVVDSMSAVTEAELRTAVRALAAEEHLVTEGAGAVATAAVLAGRIRPFGETVVLVSGSNIDLARFRQAIAAD